MVAETRNMPVFYSLFAFKSTENPSITLDSFTEKSPKSTKYSKNAEKPGDNSDVKASDHLNHNRQKRTNNATRTRLHWPRSTTASQRSSPTRFLLKIVLHIVPVPRRCAIRCETCAISNAPDRKLNGRPFQVMHKP